MGVGLRSRCHTLLWRVLPLCIVRPNTGNRESALWASAILDAILEHIMPGAADEQFLALRAMRVRAITVDISFVDVAQARVERRLPCHIKSFGRRARLVLQFKGPVKRGEMQRHLRSHMRQDP